MSQFLRDYQAITAHKRPSGRLDTFLSIRSQAEIGDARVAAIKGPFSLAVANNETARCHVGNRDTGRCQTGQDGSGEGDINVFVFRSGDVIYPITQCLSGA